ncbi:MULTISPECIES: hypothetical protein [unclassified Bradyrhizobium]|nr:MULTISPECIES: hypothetical protein [unclassified Bradyrhizobium]
MTSAKTQASPGRAPTRACDHNPMEAVRTMVNYFQFDIRHATDEPGRCAI